METIFILGFHGAGQSMIAKTLASRKNLKYVEGYKLGMKIEQGTIVSLDAEIPRDEDIIHEIKKTGRVIYLKAKPQTLYHNLLDEYKNIKIFQNNFSIMTVTNILNEYEKYYDELKNYVIAIDDKNLDTILSETLAIYNYIHKFKCHIYM